MATNNLSFFAVLLALGFLSFHCEGASTGIFVSNGASHLGSVSSINGKHFYVLDGHATNRQTAIIACESRGWRLASIETVNEVNYLKNYDLDDGVWTSGYECKNLTTFRWHNTIQNKVSYIDQSVISATTWNCYHGNALFCIVAWTRERKLNMGQESCTKNYKPLCQSV